MRPGRPTALVGVVLAMVGVVASASSPTAGAAGAGASKAQASGFRFFAYPEGQPVCALDTTGVDAPLSGLPNGLGSPYAYNRRDCGFATFTLFFPDDRPRRAEVRLYRPGGRERFGAPLPVTYDAATKTGRFEVRPGPDWPAGLVDFEVFVEGSPDAVGGDRFGVNLLKVGMAAEPRRGGGRYRPGEQVPVSGTLVQTRSARASQDRGVAGTLQLRVVPPDGRVRGPFPAIRAGNDGRFTARLPASATEGLTTLAVEAVNAAYDDPLTGAWAAQATGRTPIPLDAPAEHLVLENRYVSAKGWVKPGDQYPFRIVVKNPTSRRAERTVVTLPAVDGTTFTRVAPSTGKAQIDRKGVIRWDVGDMRPAGRDGPTVATLVVEARADSLREDPRIAWKDLSSSARLTTSSGPPVAPARSHGPKVIPPGERFESARYGDRPFPVVPVDFADRRHQPANTGERLSAVVNSPDVEGSTFNLYQEMSYGQLFPDGFVPSAGVPSANWDVRFTNPRYRDGFKFTAPAPAGTCHGVTLGPLYRQLPERISGGWYQLPGTTDYYGDDKTVSALAGRVAGLGPLGDIDSACGPAAKAVHDAAHIADPEIDYSDYDTDKDGVVDFFMMIYTGAGGNGPSLLESTPPYDNIWPHSSSLEFTYLDPATGLAGYISDDQLKDHEGRRLFYTNPSRQTMTTDRTDFPVYVRVGPYNVNPESAVEHASVISHEYGHSLGLPDFYSDGDRSTYDDWSLMANDKSQHIDVFAKQELGWLVPRTLPAGETTVRGWRDSKLNTHRIDWVEPNGRPYTLQGPHVNNGEGYVAALPSRQLIDPARVGQGASGRHVWWSGSGNDFGCPTAGGRNLDVFLPELEKVPAGTTVTASFKSLWDIEWDFDYGFVMLSTDGGSTYQSLPSRKGTTTPRALNPNSAACQQKYGNGITGSSGSYAARTDAVDRLTTATPTGTGYPDPVFLDDQFDLTAAAGKPAILRFSYSSDAGQARQGWFVDDVHVTAGDRTIYRSDFEGDRERDRLFPGGCGERVRVAPTCTKGWRYVDATAGSSADHAYYLELRDRSGFDRDGHGQNDREPIAFLPGLLLTYTDEHRGYGNVGSGDPPAQSPLDSKPEPGNAHPNLADAAFTAAAGDQAFSDSGPGHVDNYTDPAADDGKWHFGHDCLAFEVLSMSGDAIGPDRVPGDLTADVRFRTGPGCVRYNHGEGFPGGSSAGSSRPSPTRTTTRYRPIWRF